MHHVIRLVYCTLALALIQFAPAAFSQTIDIKGISIGMSQEEISKKFLNWDGFTIAGVQGKMKRSPVITEYFEGKLDIMIFPFNSEDFRIVRSAIEEKYPLLSCKNSEVGNTQGAIFDQINCTLEDTKSLLQLDRFSGDIRSSVLSISSKRRLNEIGENIKQKKKDI